MNIAEANAAYKVMYALIAGTINDADIDAAELLADRAHHTLSAGPTGAEIRHLLTISQGIDQERAS